VTLNQLEKICEVVGRPSPEEVESMRSPFARTMLENIHLAAEKPPTKWGDMYPKASEDAIDLLQKLMQWDPTNRLTSAEGMSHPYCKQFIATDPFTHDPLNRVATRVVKVPFDDNDKKSTQIYREKLYEEIVQKGNSLR